MKIVMLCEGKSDAILISYLLEKMSGWTHLKKPDKSFGVAIEDKENESAYWYSRNDDQLLICGVGGKSNFDSFFSNKIYSMIHDYPEKNTFQKIIVLRDKDTDSISETERNIQNCLHPISTTIQNDTWVKGYYKDSFDVDKTIDVLGLVIPFDSDGALETVLLNSLKEEGTKKEIVERSESFVEQVTECAKEFIFNPRMELKAKLGVTFAVLSPMKVFSFIDEIIRTVEWEKSEHLIATFDKIIKL